MLNNSYRYLALITLCGGLGIFGQTGGLTASITPPAIEGGEPSGSYAVSDFETISLFSGNLNFHLPLHHVGGRGDAQYTMVLPIERRWRIDSEIGNDGKPSGRFQANSNLSPISGWWYTGVPLFSPGVLEARASGYGVADSTLCPTIFESTLTRLTFIQNDGTETELVDQQLGGAAATSNVCPGATGGYGQSRGTVFVARDGSGMTFIADQTVKDRLNMDWVGVFTAPSGELVLGNGLRYKVSSGGLISAMVDRQGNAINFTYSSGMLTDVWDSLGRHVQITQTASAYQIKYPGTGGTLRTISVNYTQLANVMPQGQVPVTYFDLWGTWGSQDPSIFNPLVVSSVQLANSTSQYTFQYNAYAEPLKVTLPTGGNYQYQWDGSVISSASSGPFAYRYVTNRSVYLDNQTLEGQIGYQRSYAAFTYQSASYRATTVTVNHKDGAGSSLSQDVHQFLGDPTTPDSEQSLAIPYVNWKNGKEIQTDEKTASGAATLRTKADAWVQRPCASGEVCPTAIYLGGTSSLDPRISDTQITLAGSPNQVALTSYSYDRYNNKTDVFAYGFGASSPPLLRHERTTYQTNTYDTDLLIHLKSLPQQTTISDGNGYIITNTVYGYDETALSPTPTCVAQSGGTLDCSGYILGYAAPRSVLPTDYHYRGNLTSVKRCTVPDRSDPATCRGTWVGMSLVYDLAGNVTSSTDGRDKATTASYADRDSSCALVAGGAQKFAFATLVTNPLLQQVITGYDYDLGKARCFQDPNSQTTTYAYGTNSDALDRPGLLTRPDSSTVSFAYVDTAGQVKVTTTASQDSCNLTNSIENDVLFDGLGRTKLMHRATRENASGILQLQTYDSLGHRSGTSNPSFTTPSACSSSTCTTQSYDALGRTTEIKTPDGAKICKKFDGASETSVDAASHWRMVSTDALGRIVQVVENPAAATCSLLTNTSTEAQIVTNYAYDGLNNLSIVCQGGTLSGTSCIGGLKRNFTYDGLSRLTSAYNPESSPTESLPTYYAVLDGSGAVLLDLYRNPQSGYDGNGNLISKKDALGTITRYSYDSVNRLLKKTYSGGTAAATPDAIFCYDGSNTNDCAGATVSENPIGRLTFTKAESSGTTISSTAYSYNTVGLPKGSIQAMGTKSYPFIYTYNKSGSLETLTYPLSGRSVKTCYDSGQPISVTAGTTQYVVDAHYGVGGGLTTLSMAGGNITEVTDYSTARIQTVATTVRKVGTTDPVLNLRWSHCGAAPDGSVNEGCAINNGDVLSAKVVFPDRTKNGILIPSLDSTATYSYDSLDRLKSAVESVVGANGWQQHYGYDRFGNRAHLIGASELIPDGPATPQEAVLDPALIEHQFSGNRWLGGGSSWGDSGNLNSRTSAFYKYDGENRLDTATTIAGTTKYLYDAEGRRVQKILGYGESNPGITTFVYDASGQLASEVASATDSGTRYLSVDVLGSTRLVMDDTGEPVMRYDYLPFGGEIPAGSFGRNQEYSAGAYPNAAPYKQKLDFTGKERDAETGLDYFGARYMSSAQGRFTSPDPGNRSAHRVNPQSWNAYTYANNNPLALVDPNGLEPVRAQAGTIHGFAQNMNSTPHKVGMARGAAAASALSSLGETKNFGPANTAVFNMSPNRYVYTANGGWVDMVHFVFYAGRAAGYKAAGNSNPVGEAVQDGYTQERVDTFKAPWSAYSYEDLPSDLYGAIFGAQYFDPTSPLTLAEQIEVYMSYLSPMPATSAPNYAALPARDSKNPPTARNHTTNPMYTFWWSSWLLNQPEPKPAVSSTITYK